MVGECFSSPFYQSRSYKEQNLTFQIACVCMYVCFPHNRTGFSNYTSQVLSSIHLYLNPQCSSFFFFYFFCSSPDMLPSHAVSQLSSFSHFPPGSPKYTHSHSLSLSNIYLSVYFSKKTPLTTLKAVIPTHDSIILHHKTYQCINTV